MTSKKTPTQIVVDRLIAAGIHFRDVPNKTKVVSKGNLRENLLVSVDGRLWSEDLGADVPGHPHKYGRYQECSLASPIRDLAKGTILVHSSMWIHGRYNMPELRLSCEPLKDSLSKLILTIEPPTVTTDEA